MASSGVVSIKSVPRTVDAATRQFLESLKTLIEIREGQRGNPLDKNVTLRDLQDAGINIFDGTRYNLEGNTTGSTTCTKAPQPPRDLLITNRIFSNQLVWTLPDDDTVSVTEIWRATSQSKSLAKLIGIATAPTDEFVDNNIDLRTEYYYWIRTVTAGGCYSTWEPNDAQGGYLVAASDNTSIQEMLTLLTGNISEDQLAQKLLDRIDLIDTTSFIFDDDIYEDDIYGGAITNVIDIGVYTFQHIKEIANLLSLNDDRVLDIQALEAVVNDFVADDYNYGAYSSGSPVRHEGVVYKAIQDVPANTPPPNTTYWEVAPNIVTLVSNVESRVDAVEGEIVNKVDQVDYDVLEGTVEAHSTAITQNADNILLKAAQTDLDLANETIESHTTAIAQNAEQITLSSSAITGPITFEDDIYEDDVFVLEAGDVVNLDIRVTEAAITISEHDGILLEHTSQLITNEDDITAAKASILVLSDADEELQAQIDLKVAIVDFDELETRTAAAESIITAWDDPTTGLVSQIQERVQILTYNSDMEAVSDDILSVQSAQSTLDLRIGQAESTLDTHETALGDIEAEWTVKLNANGQIAGVGLMTSSEGWSEFVVLADKFLFVKPDGTGTGTPLMVLGDINGETALGVDGNLIIDGTIVTRHIDSESITATHIGANEIITQYANIADGVITAQHVGANELIANTANIKDGVITSAKIASLDAGKITTGYLSADRIAAGSIDAGKISATSLSSISANLGTITAGVINADQVTVQNLTVSNWKNAPLYSYMNPVWGDTSTQVFKIPPDMSGVIVARITMTSLDPGQPYGVFVLQKNGVNILTNARIYPTSPTYDISGYITAGDEFLISPDAYTSLSFKLGVIVGLA